MIEIDVLHEQIRSCRACEDAGFLVKPPPLVWGTAPSPFMLIGQAPSKTDMMQRHMYVGPAAQKLLGWLRLAGFSDDDFGTVLYMTALTKCFPGRLAGKSTDRAPTAREQALCQGWLTRQIELIQPEVIILFGKLAIDRFLGSGSMTERIGRSFERGGKVYIPLPHSSGASTWLNVEEHRAQLKLAIEVIGDERRGRLSLQAPA